jgi:hypothetical protein
VLHLIERDETGAAASGQLASDHPAVIAANQCELMLPEQLTLESLAAAARHKIDNVQVLLARAREHESLPREAQLAADEGYQASVDGLPDAADNAPRVA